MTKKHACPLLPYCARFLEMFTGACKIKREIVASYFTVKTTDIFLQCGLILNCHKKTIVNENINFRKLYPSQEYGKIFTNISHWFPSHY